MTGRPRQPVARWLVLGGQLREWKALEVAEDLGARRRRIQRRDVDAALANASPSCPPESPGWAPAGHDRVHDRAIGAHDRTLLDEVVLDDPTGLLRAGSEVQWGAVALGLVRQRAQVSESPGVVDELARPAPRASPSRDAWLQARPWHHRRRVPTSGSRRRTCACRCGSRPARRDRELRRTQCTTSRGRVTRSSECKARRRARTRSSVRPGQARSRRSGSAASGPLHRRWSPALVDERTASCLAPKLMIASSPLEVRFGHVIERDFAAS